MSAKVVRKLEGKRKDKREKRAEGMVEEKEIAYGLGWVFPFRLFCSAPKGPLRGTLVATLHSAHFPPPYLCLRQSRAELPAAEPTVRACQCACWGSKVDKCIEGAVGERELKLYLYLVPPPI